MALEPAKEEEEGVVPYNKSGRNCPLLNKPCKDVCHTCEMWQALDLLINGQMKTVWRCSYIWSATLAGRMSVQLSMLENEVHRHSDKMEDLHEGLLNANMALARGAAEQMRLMGARQNELENQREGDGPASLEGDAPDGGRRQLRHHQDHASE